MNNIQQSDKHFNVELEKKSKYDSFLELSTVLSLKAE